MQWVNWCNRFQEIDPLPANTQHIILFKFGSVKQAKSNPVTESTVMAIKYFHNVSGYEFKQNVRTCFEGLKKVGGKES